MVYWVTAAGGYPVNGSLMYSEWKGNGKGHHDYAFAQGQRYFVGKI